MPEGNGKTNGVLVKWLIPLLLSVAAVALGAGQWVGRSDTQDEALGDSIRDLRAEMRQELGRIDDKLDEALERLARLEGEVSRGGRTAP